MEPNQTSDADYEFDESARECRDVLFAGRFVLLIILVVVMVVIPMVVALKG